MNWLSRLGGPALRGVLDQALTSAENFAIGMILVRTCPPSEFGLYGLGYGILVLAWSVLAALVTAHLPRVISEGESDPEAQHDRCAALLRSLLRACLVTMGFSGLAIGALAATRAIGPFDYAFWLLVCAALPATCLRDFMRRYSFQHGTGSSALWMDGASLAITVAALLVLAALHAAHMHRAAVATLAAGGLLTAVISAMRRGLLGLPAEARAGARQSAIWRQGGWNVVATLVSWVQTQTYTLYVTVLLGLVALAGANAPRVLLTPISLLSTGLMLPLLPRLAARRHKLGALVGLRAGLLLAALAACAVSVYLAALWLLRDEIVARVLTDRYSSPWTCMVAWAVVSVFTNLRVYFATFMLSKGEFRASALANGMGAVVVISVTAPMIHWFGVLGSIYAIAVGEFVLGILLWRRSTVIARSLASAA